MWSEHLSSTGGDDPVVFETDAELAGDVDAGLVGKGHAGGEWCSVAADEVGPLVTVHADAVAEAVGEVLVIGAVVGVGDDFACGVVDRVAWNAGTGCGERGCLSLVHDIKDLLLLVGGFTEDEGARHVGLIALDGAAIVDEDDLVLADDLRLEGAVGQGGVFADLAACVAGEAAAKIGGADELAELTVCHAWLGGFVDGLVDLESDVVGEAHERELCWGFNATATKGDWGSADGGEAGTGVSDAIGEGELGALFDANLPGRDAGLLECFGQECIGIFVFVPGVDLCGGGGGQRGGLCFHALADPAFFKDGADNERSSLYREHPTEEALRLAPAEAGEVVERSSGGDDESVDLVLREESTGAFETLLAFGQSDGGSLGTAAGQCGNCRRKFEVGGW